jgi:acyl carrier protein
MDDGELLSRLQDIMADVFDEDDLTVTRETSAEDVEDWDSLSHIRLMVAVEREFGVKFTNAEIEHLEKVGDLIDLIKQKNA